MQAKSIEFYNFRNLSRQIINLDAKTTLFFGNNGQGKSNILEGIWLFSCGKSFRAAQDREMIAFSQSESRLKFSASDGRRNLSMEAIIKDGRRKEFYVSGEKLLRSADLLGEFATVLFEPDNLGLIKGPPEGRRRFMDISLCQQSKGYFNAIREYNKLLERRCALLKQIAAHTAGEETLNVWDEALCQRGSRVAHDRYEYTELLKDYGYSALMELSDGCEQMKLEYSCQAGYEKTDGMFEQYLYLLKKNRQADIWSGSTSCGPHRDDLSIMINANSAKKYGSSGQKRSAVLALKIAEGRVIERTLGTTPVFLLDDVLSELDIGRREYVLNRIKDFQVIITDCERFDGLSGARCYRVCSGRAEEV